MTDAAKAVPLLPAADARLRRAVAIVDALPERGEADALIAPLRPRLAELRPPRPITLTRLLFIPVERLIAPSTTWHESSPAIPRSTLAVLGTEVRTALGEQAAAELQAQMSGHSMDEAATVAACGAVLWPRAGALLPGRPVPHGWSTVTGLPATAYPAITAPLAVLLAEGVALHHLTRRSNAAAQAEADRLLRHAEPHGPAASAMMLALLLRLLPGARHLLQSVDPAVADRAMAFVLAGLHGGVPPDAPPAEAADQVRRSAVMLEELEVAAGTVERPARMQMLRMAREALAGQCHTQLTMAADRLTGPAEPPRGSAGFMAMEDTARAMRRLDAIGRRLGGPEGFDQALSGAAERLAADRRLPQMARLRLAEILLGADAALALVEDG
jgi:hypothetical protein